MKTGREKHSCAVANIQGVETIIVAGGFDSNGTILPSVEFFSSDSNEFKLGIISNIFKTTNLSKYPEI